MYGYEVWVCARAWWYDAAVDDEGADCEEGVGVEEGCDLFPACPSVLVHGHCIARIYSLYVTRTDCCKLAPNMYDHDDSHDQGEYVRETCRSLENDGIRQFDRSRVAIRLCVVCASQRRFVSHERA